MQSRECDWLPLVSPSVRRAGKRRGSFLEVEALGGRVVVAETVRTLSCGGILVGLAGGPRLAGVSLASVGSGVVLLRPKIISFFQFLLELGSEHFFRRNEVIFPIEFLLQEVDGDTCLARRQADPQT